MEIRIRTTGAVMYESEFRNLHPATSFPPQLTADLLNDFDADPVLEGAQVSGDRYQYSQRSGVEEVNGQWFTKYVLGPVFTDNEEATAVEQEAAYKAAKDEEQAKSIRTSRNEKLKECDWTQVADAPVDQAAWATYRQALRDVTSQVGFPWDIIWPNDPNYVES
jgi:hypothetical protein